MSFPQGEARAVWLLALAQTLVYAGVYYGFPSLLPALVAETGWSTGVLAAGPTLGFLVMAVLAPFSGRLVDRGFGGELLIIMPAVAAVGLAGLAFAPTPFVWLFLWAVIGVAQAGAFYETCFAFLTRRLGAEARPAITKVTLVAGFAGSFAFPLGGWLGRHWGGQEAFLAFAALILIGAVPANALAVRQLRRLDRRGGPKVEADPAALHDAMRRPEFWALSALFLLVMLNHGVLLTYILLLFEDRGASVAAATLAASLLGPSQVLGRFLLMTSEVRVGNARAMRISLAMTLTASGVLWLAGWAPGLVLLFALLQGAGIGLVSILRPLLIGDILGRNGFGAIAGAVAVAPILASAAAPSAGALLLHVAGTGAVYPVSCAMAATSFSLGLWLLRRR